MKFKELVDKVYDILNRHNPNDFKNLSMDEQGEMCIRIARAIKFEWK